MARLIAEQSSLTLGGGPWWAILDATDAIPVVRYLQEMEIEHVSLYKGEAEEHYWDIAPYLARLDQPLLDWLRDHYWDEPWGIALTSPASLADLRAHFRKFLRVKDMQGNSLYFRFYDPRVLAAFLPRCIGNELPEFFGPVQSFWAQIRKTDNFKSFKMAEEPKPTSAAEAGR